MALCRAAALVVFLAGCGGTDEGPKPIAQQQRPQPMVKGPPPIPIRPRRKVEAEQPPPADEPAEPGPAYDPSVDPNDIFRVTTGEPNFEVLGPAPEVDPAEVAGIAVPPAGGDSTTFALVGVPAPAPEGQPSPDLQLPAGFLPIAAAGYSPDGLPRQVLCEADGARMVLVAGGEFVQGKNGSGNAEPEFRHTLDPFYIDVTEITLARYELFRKSRQERGTGIRVPDPPLNASQPPDFPAVGVGFNDARAYAVWAGKDLPTEAEWERAARGPQNFAHPWGEGRAIWGRPRTGRQIDAVMSFRTDVSPFGVFDLAGNAREWCLDWYWPTSYQQAGGAAENWKGVRTQNKEFERVVRGNGPNWEAWFREGRDSRHGHADVGFRCVLRADVKLLRRLKLESARSKPEPAP